MSRFALVMLLVPTAAFGQKQYGFDNRKASGQPYLTPAESVARMKVADGFEVKLYAGEPMIVNPIAFTVDERGRVWVVECFEYPSRTPKGKMPRDRIVILEDTDGDGVADKRTVFAEGKDFPERFDMASGIEVGNGGVYVGAPPYLWFIENKGDKPGKFTKLLGGFGSQDTHETLNTFQWGPDGWLYGLHGIYTQSKVTVVTPRPESSRGAAGSPAPLGDSGRGDTAPVELNAGLWRFHPKTHKFEVVSEGTSNPWGWDYRNTDGQTIAACCVIPHLYHLVPGGNYKRQSGQGFNPYAYGQINEICDHTFHKESGWAHAGLLSLDTPLMPEHLRESVIFGSIHGCSVKRNTLKPNGSTYTASRADDFLVSGDKNFRPINMRWGPNGEILLIDWHDQNPCHQAEAGSWDYERGRVYRIQQKGTLTKKPTDLGASPAGELVKRLDDPNPYISRTSLRLLRERPDQLSVRLRDRLAAMGHALWLDGLGLLGDEDIRRALYPNTSDRPTAEPMNRASAIRRQEAIRALGLSGQVSTGSLDEVTRRAAAEPSAAVRREMASLVQRHANSSATTPLLHHLLEHREDATDPAIPHLLWLGFEPKLSNDASMELAWLEGHTTGNALLTDYIVPRSTRRLGTSAKPDDLGRAVAFIGQAKDGAVRRRGLEGLTEALKGRVVDPPEVWRSVQVGLASDADPQIQKLARSLAGNFNDRRAIAAAVAAVADASRSHSERLDAVRLLALARPPQALSQLMATIQSGTNEEIRIEACRALAGYESPEIAKLAAGWATYSPGLKAEIVNLLAGRKAWAKELIAAVAAGRIERSALNASTIRRMQALKDKALDAAIEAGWGKLRDTPAELVKLIDTMRGELDKAPASFAKGKAVFEANCAKCHQFEGRGFTVGPALDGAGRDVEYILVNVLDPNRVVGRALLHPPGIAQGWPVGAGFAPRRRPTDDHAQGRERCTQGHPEGRRGIG
ncbi:MAG: PVC-type heme-binding CxxCH protein [Gemmataceae bacterium]